MTRSLYEASGVVVNAGNVQIRLARTPALSQNSYPALPAVRVCQGAFLAYFLPIVMNGCFTEVVPLDYQAFTVPTATQRHFKH